MRDRVFTSCLKFMVLALTALIMVSPYFDDKHKKLVSDKSEELKRDLDRVYESLKE